MHYTYLTAILSTLIFIQAYGAANQYDGNLAYSWCPASSEVFICARNVRIVPFEGSIALLQLGLLWKEQSSVADNQIRYTDSSDSDHADLLTSQTWKLRRMWTTETSPEEKKLVRNFQNALYDSNQYDEEPKQYIYANQWALGSDEYMAGDIIPFRGCAYILHMNSDTDDDQKGTLSSKQYAVERLRLDIMYDNVRTRLQQKIYVDSELSFMVQTTQMNDQGDFNAEGEEINWWPGWGSFYWGTRGTLWLVQDTTFDLDAFYEEGDSYYADPSSSTFDDPCHRDYALFGSNTGDANRLNLDVTTNDSNIKFTSIDYLTPQQQTEGNFSTYKLAAHTFSISWFWFIAVGQDELMTVKGRPDTGFTLSDRCNMNGAATCTNTASFITFDLKYIICHIRFGQDVCAGTGDAGQFGCADAFGWTCPYARLTEVSSEFNKDQYDAGDPADSGLDETQPRLLHYAYFGECRFADETSFTGMTAMDKYGVNLSIESCGVQVQYRPCLQLDSDSSLVVDASSKQLVQESDTVCEASSANYVNLIYIGLEQVVEDSMRDAADGPTTVKYVPPGRTFQARGEMIAHRPTYVAYKELPTLLRRFTTSEADFAVAGTPTTPGVTDNLLGDTDTVDFWNYYSLDNPHAITLLRFHLVTVHPGNTHTWHDNYISYPYDSNDSEIPTMGDLKENIERRCWDGDMALCGVEDEGAQWTDWTFLDGIDLFGEWKETEEMNVIVFNMRTKTITHRIPLETCGNGIVDDYDTWFEECEIANSYVAGCSDIDGNSYCPGEYLYNCDDVDNPGISDYCYAEQPEAGMNSGTPARGDIFGPGSPIDATWASYGPSAPTGHGSVDVFWRRDEKKYFVCNEYCHYESVASSYTCHDGLESNGGDTPDAYDPYDDSWDATDDTNRREYCDESDGALFSQRTAGCSADCRTITPGWECLIWGESCSILCGNGVVNDMAVANGRSAQTRVDDLYSPTEAMTYVYDGTNIESFQEECDMGVYNIDLSTVEVGTEYLYPCTHLCMWNVGYTNREGETDNMATGMGTENFYQKIWDCGSEFTGDSDFADTGLGTYTSRCTMTMGDGVLDWDRGERCEPGLQPVRSLSASDADGVGGGWDCGDWLACATVGAGTDGSFRFDRAAILYYFDTNSVQWSNDMSPVYDAMLLGCWHTIDATDTPRLGQPVIGWQFPDEDGLSFPNTLGTDTCGDLVFDGAYPEVGRAWPQRMGVDADSTYGPMYEFPATLSSIATGWFYRKLPEQCDNGGDLMSDYSHGCDRLCQVMDDWDCYHYFKEFEPTGYEVPIYASKCEPTAANHAWRRLKQENFNKERRRLDHTDVYTNLQTLPTNNNDFEMNHLIFHDKLGLNGQVRMIENPYPQDATSDTGPYDQFGIIYGQQYTDSTEDFVQFAVSSISAGALLETPSDLVTETWPVQMRVYKGKVRTVLGPWLIVNEDPYTFTVYGWDGSGTDTQTLGNMATSTKKDALQLLGSHEFYWWPNRSYLLSRLSDGMTFQFSRFAAGFGTAADFTADEDTQTALRLLQVQGRVTIAPLFEGDLAIFYTSERVSSDGNLYFYLFDSFREQLELVYSDNVRSETSTEYQSYSFVKLGNDMNEGILFKAPYQGDSYRYDISAFDWGSGAEIKSTASSVVVSGDFSGYGTFSLEYLIFKQFVEDPFHYSLSQDPQKIYGWMSHDYVYELSWDKDNLQFTVAGAYPIPSKYYWGGKAEHVDFGRKRFVILSPLSCDNTAETNSQTANQATIDNPSSRFFEYVTEFQLDDGVSLNLDGNASIADNGYVDITEIACDLDLADEDESLNDLCGDLIDYDDGWTCRDLDATEESSQAWVICEGAIHSSYTYCSL